MAVDWVSVQNALQTWVASTSGLQAIWDDQAAAQPPLPYAMLSLGPPLPLPGLSPVTTVYNSGGAPGAEIVTTVTEIKRVTATVEVFSKIVTGSGKAMEYLSTAMTSLFLPGQLDKLYAAGISVIDRGPVHDLSKLVANRFQSRASCAVRLYVVDQVSQTDTYISTAEYTPTVNGVALPVVDIILP